MTSDACVASAPFGKNDELLFSCTEVNLPKSGPNIPLTMNQAITTNMASAYGLRFLVVDDTVIRAFHKVVLGGFAMSQAYL